MDELAIGRLGAPHGVEGRLKASTYSGETRHFFKLREATLARGDERLRLAVEEVAEHGAGLLIKFAGYDSPEDARALAGMELLVPRDQAAPKGPDEYYYGELIGCSLVDGERELARVVAIGETGGGILLEAELPDGRRSYVPFRKEFTGVVDVEAKTIELLAPWVLE
jgi:16S rRNA processing protein RimM